MKALALRQVKLLAPAALATVGLGLLMAIVASALESTARISIPPFEVAATLVLYVAPWLLGIAAIAPDGESGALAFLGTLPLGRKRHLALRAGVALVMTLAVVAPFLVLVEVTSRHGLRGLPAQSVLSPVLFVGALAAGATTRQSLGAFIAAPLLIAAPVTAFGAFLSTVHAPNALYGLMYPGVMLALAVAAATAFADPGRQLARRALRVTGVLAGALGLGCGVTTACWAAAAAAPERVVDADARGDVLVVHDDLYPDWPGLSPTYRTVLFDRAELASAAAGPDLLATGWRRDGRWWLCAPSPDGRLALLAGLEQRVELVDVQERRVLARAAASLWQISSPPPGRSVSVAATSRVACGWLEGAPWVLRQDGAVQRLDGEELLRLPDGVTVWSCGGSRLVVGLDSIDRRSEAPTAVPADGSLFELIDLGSGVRTVVAADGPPRLSPCGEVLALLSTEHEETPRLLLRRVADPTHGVSVDLDAIDMSDDPSLTFSPDARRVIVEWRTSRPDVVEGTYRYEGRLVDLETGEVRPSPTLLWATAWSPDGTKLVDGFDTWVDLTETTPVARQVGGERRRSRNEPWLVWFDDDRTVIRARLPEGEVERITLTR